MFLSLTVIATVVSTDVLVNFSFMLLLAMALPNILGLFILAGDVKKDLRAYRKKLDSGELDAETIEAETIKAEAIQAETQSEQK
jgi:AGCS family alanine or glycine:cation symporter